MTKEWVMVYSAFKAYKIDIIQGLLAESGIESNTINKQDSNYLFGEIELYVCNDDAFKAKQIIEKHPDL